MTCGVLSANQMFGGVSSLFPTPNFIRTVYLDKKLSLPLPAHVSFPPPISQSPLTVPFPPFFTFSAGIPSKVFAKLFPLSFNIRFTVSFPGAVPFSSPFYDQWGTPSKVFAKLFPKSVVVMSFSRPIRYLSALCPKLQAFRPVSLAALCRSHLLLSTFHIPRSVHPV